MNPEDSHVHAALDLQVVETDTPPRSLTGPVAGVVKWGSAALSMYALYWVVGSADPFHYRVIFLLGALVLTFLSYSARGQKAAPGSHSRPSVTDWVCVALSVTALGWPLLASGFEYRAAVPTAVDLVLGSVALVLVLEATRRTVGWILPATAVGFIAYAYLGPLLDLIGLDAIGHRGYELDRLIGLLYMTMEGILGVPLDVASTYIILFTLYGAVLEHSGAGEFFIQWAMAALGGSQRGAGPGRTVTAAGFLLGTVSGSGVATTVTLGSVAWPLLRRAGYPPETAGAILSAAGIGAILSPPTLGAAAFLIAEFLRIPFLQVLVMATIPTVLYYLSSFLMIEADSRRLLRSSAGVPAGGPAGVDGPTLPFWRLTLRYGYHFTSLVAIVVLLLTGMTPFRAVFWATILAAALSFLDRVHALWPRRLLAVLADGGRGVLSIAATTATAGVIVGVVSLTGLGLKIAGLIVAIAGGNLFMTVVLAALAVWMLGLAVPVTASYIIAAVMIAPALTVVGVAPAAAHMFIFYYAVLSEVSPPTALSPFAAAAITGGNPFKTMMLTWKYTLPAFLVPFAFTLSQDGMGVLMQGSASTIATATLTAAAGVCALAAGLGGWLRGAATLLERIAFCASGLLLFYAHPISDLAGLITFGTVAVVHSLRVARHRSA